MLYSGTQPASPETALSGNTALATFTFTSSAFAAGTFSMPYEGASANFSSTSVSPSAGGSATFMRLFTSGAVAEADLVVCAAYSSITVGSSPVAGTWCTSGSNAYKCTTSGATAGTAPTGTTTSTDGSCVWTYEGPSAASGQTPAAVDVTLGNVIVQSARLSASPRSR